LFSKREVLFGSDDFLQKKTPYLLKKKQKEETKSNFTMQQMITIPTIPILSYVKTPVAIRAIITAMVNKTTAQQQSIFVLCVFHHSTCI
jgi:hypothetical protein